ALRTKLPLEFLAPEEEQLLAALQDLRNVDRPAQGESQIVEAEQSARLAAGADRLPVADPVIRIETVMAMEPISAAVNIRRAALGHHVDLRAHRPAVFGLVHTSQHLELLNRVQAEGHVHRTIRSGVDVADAVDRELVRIGAGTISGDVGQS